MPHPSTSPHADHDRLLIAAYAAGDASGPDLETAQALVARCAGCSALHHDLRAIAGAVGSLPAPVRTRDFRLTTAQAAALRPPAWRRLLEPFAGPRFAFAGPLGTGLATLGLAGLLVAGPLGMPMAGAGAASGGSTPELAATGDDGGAAGAESGAPLFAAPVTPQSSLAPVEAPAAASAPPDASGRQGDNGNAAPQAVGVQGEASPVGDGALAPSVEPDLSIVPEVEDASGEPEIAGDPLKSLPAPVPMPAVAAVLLLAGLLMGGLRLVARRVG